MNHDSCFLRISPADNVAVALKDIPKDTTVRISGIAITSCEEILFGHKMALRQIEPNDDVIKYGYPIGHATHRVCVGQWVHTHNCKTNLKGLKEYHYESESSGMEAEALEDTFAGYVRDNGEVGIRNEIWIIPTVGCVNHTIKLIQDEAQKRYGHLCDGIYAFPHVAGCSQLGNDHKTTQQILAGIVRHPNAGGVLVVSLGCENNDLAHFKPVLDNIDERRVKFLVTQDVGNEIEEGLTLIGELARYAAGFHRQPVLAGRLKIGLKCGASDAFSGITANPLCGAISDKITGMQGIAILTEVPEMFGAETILMNRADSPSTYNEIVNLINAFKKYYMDYGQPIYENPSPGNKAGGITTLEEKSLGCTQKGGSAIVTDTLDYGEISRTPGLNLLTGPGNDSVSITNLLASGAHLILFTTGRGNPLGTAIPTIKISSNNQLYERKSNWIDFNAGGILYGGALSNTRDRLWDFLLDVASGRQKTKNEIYGHREIAIFKNGVLL